ncbi:MAG: PEP-CTERM sorting domain-containing protein [Planctomycetota bacterium]
MRMQLATAATVVALACGTTAHAAVAYDFEGDLQGFASNGGVFPVTLDTIGATSGVNSMKVEVPGGATFVGALTGNVTAPVNDPPGVESLVFDLTIVEEFTGAFADIGITIFGASQPDFPGGQLFGLQAQFADIAPLGVAPGTYEITLDLDSATNPITFGAGESFNDIFGGFGTGPNDLIPTGVQFFVSKSGDAPVTFYIDNVRTVIPEPTALALITAGLAFGLRSRHR